MGLLTEGTPLSWDEIVAVREEFRHYALAQLVRIFQKSKDRQGDSFMWGDELEFCMIRFDHHNRRAQLLLKAHQLLPRLIESNETIQNKNYQIAWHPEACDYMIEGVPAKPYGCGPSYLNTVEANMAFRRRQAQKFLSEDSDCEYVLNVAAFLQFGQHRFLYRAPEDDSDLAPIESLDYSNAIVSPQHPRMKSLMNNTSNRRQSVPPIHIPIFQDTLASSSFHDHQLEQTTNVRDHHICLEGVLVGWGCCCLQVTFQAQSLSECVLLHDQLLPLTAIMLALSSACPIWGGYLTDIDCRYNVLSQAGDDRTPEERQRSTMMSRCSSTLLYLSDQHNHLNDIKLDMNESVVSILISHGMSPTLARHYGYLFMRDPLVVLKEHLYPVDDSSTYHFESLNSTVWYSLRLKPPPLDDDRMGWRIEFRPMDIQMTDFENAALAVFMALLTRVILTYGLDLTIPISQINENMKQAHHRDSVRQGQFYFRAGDQSRMMSIDEIINGVDHFPGLVPLVRRYLYEHEHFDSDTRLTVEHYLSLISKRAAGVLLTNASWIRQFVMSHADYKHDSVVSDQIQYDLLWKTARIANGHESCPLVVESQMRTKTKLCSD